MIPDGQGGFLVKYRLKEGVPEAVGEAYVADGVLDVTDSQREESEEENSFMQQSLWRDRNRGMSVDNEKGCDEIMRQFFTVDFNQSMMLPETTHEPLNLYVNPSTDYGSED